jgi:hypothetical protein
MEEINNSAHSDQARSEIKQLTHGKKYMLWQKYIKTDKR